MRERLLGSEPLELPVDRPRPRVLSDARSEQVFSLTPQLVTDLQRVAHKVEARFTSVLLAAYTTLLSRYSGGAEFALAVLDPSLQGGEHAVDALLVHCGLAGEPSFEELVARVKDDLEAARRVALGSDRGPTMGSSSPGTERDGPAPVQAAFVSEMTRAAEEAIASVAATAELTLVLDSEERARFVYASELFDEDTIRRMADNFTTLLTALASDVTRSVDRLELLHASELAALRAFNRTELTLPLHAGGFHALVLEQAARTPERVAVIDAAGEESYGELARAAARWSAQLAAVGVTPGARVGVALGRTRRAVEAVLGVLSAGATYVPLDPGFPSDRLAFMIEDAGLAALIVEESTRSLLPPGAPAQLLAEEVERAAPGSASAPKVFSSAPDDVAYILYTSGSTGRPKGVQVAHANVVNFLVGAARQPGIARDDRVLAVSTFSFDISILELFLPLTVGACTMLGPRMCAADGATLSRYIDDFGATFVQATPTTFGLLVQAGLPRRRFKALVGGEPFPPKLARELAGCCSEIWNCYGPTETTVWSSFQRIVDADAPISIGRPMANTRMYVLDALKQPVPMGVTGELYIGGLGVSRGYRNRPELDAERFLSDPFAESAGARMYRTGDLARMRPGGLQYLGRVDTQVKLRGYRIELGEIESVLSAHRAVDACAVVVRELAADDQRLVAYFLRARGEEASREELSSHLSQRLPSYMVPRFIMELSELPMTPSGKIDRKRLPDPRGHEVAPSAARVAPRHATDSALLEIWRSVLGAAGLGIDDDFFALGGHSLLAVQLVHQLNTAFRTSFPLSFVFEAPTIRAQAERIDLGAHGGGVSAIPLKRGEGQPLFCVCGINLYQSLAERLRTERPVYGLFLPIEAELLQDSAVELDARAMARQYVEVLRSVQPHGPYHLAGVSFGGVLAYEIARQLRSAGEDVSLLALLDVVLPDARPRETTSRRRLLRLAARVPLLLRTGVARLRRMRRRNGRRDPALLAAMEDWEALQAYREERYDAATAHYVSELPPYDGDVLLVRAREQVKSMPGCAVDYGWSQFVEGQLTCVDIPGDHLGILREPHVDELSAILSTFL